MQTLPVNDEYWTKLISSVNFGIRTMIRTDNEQLE